jgi:hypothetical protein
MKPVTVSITVPNRREEVYDLIDVLGNHEAFTDHFLIDWTLRGPAAGVGAGARMRVRKPGRPDWLEMTVIEAQRPSFTVEESVSAKGRRRTRGTYRLEAQPDGGTRIAFELAWVAAPWWERVTAQVTRAVVRRANATALRRLRGRLAAGRATGITD